MSGKNAVRYQAKHSKGPVPGMLVSGGEVKAPSIKTKQSMSKLKFLAKWMKEPQEACEQKQYVQYLLIHMYIVMTSSVQRF